MAAREKLYRRLPGRASSLAGYHRVYRAADHLLVLASTGYSETYKRFYFRDIQAIIVQRTNRWQIMSWLCGGPLLICLVVWMANLLSDTGWSTEGVVWLVILSVVCGLLLAINLALGPTCSCYVQTAVQTERILAIVRFPTARKFLNLVRPLILNAQTTADSSAASGPVSAAPS